MDSRWIQFGANVSAAAGLSLTSTKFLAASFGGSSHSTSGFSPQALFNEGLLDSAPGKLISASVPKSPCQISCGQSD
jgi:hypothetical protein